MHPLIIVLGAALLDIGANMAINRSVGFRYKGWGFLSPRSETSKICASSDMPW